jgi:hypothetical protein
LKRRNAPFKLAELLEKQAAALLTNTIGKQRKNHQQSSKTIEAKIDWLRPFKSF